MAEPFVGIAALLFSIWAVSVWKVFYDLLVVTRNAYTDISQKLTTIRVLVEDLQTADPQATQQVQEWTQKTFHDLVSALMLKTAPAAAPLMIRERRLEEEAKPVPRPQAVPSPGNTTVYQAPTPVPTATLISKG